jgi:hypothetical protein
VEIFKQIWNVQRQTRLIFCAAIFIGDTYVKSETRIRMTLLNQVIKYSCLQRCSHRANTGESSSLQCASLYKLHSLSGRNLDIIKATYKTWLSIIQMPWYYV